MPTNVQEQKKPEILIKSPPPSSSSSYKFAFLPFGPKNVPVHAESKKNGPV